MSGPAEGTDDAQSLRAMQEAAWANKRAKGFNTTDVPLEFCLLTGEVAEAFEAWRRGGDVGEELADVVIYAAGLASILSMDLEAEVARKLGVNAARVYERRPDGTVVKREGGLEPPRERARRPGAGQGTRRSAMGRSGMRRLFEHNRVTRHDWLAWCADVEEDELLKTRPGGQRSILANLFHVVDVEYSWLAYVCGRPEFDEPFERYSSLSAIVALDRRLRPEVASMLDFALVDMGRSLYLPWAPGETATVEEILAHTAVHEVHHMGQISVWAREIGRRPVSANLIGR
jgi:uncharacterized damage-inducible protein DinB/NTP pyrophosphatase (non-canonical NTP hydrolase)